MNITDRITAQVIDLMREIDDYLAELDENPGE